MNIRRLKELARQLKEVKNVQKNKISDVITHLWDRVEELEESRDMASELDDAYFWVLVRAQLDGTLDQPSEPYDEDAFRQGVVEDLQDLQMEYFVCQSLAYFLESLGSE
jgi:hypothetical protein